MNDRATRVEFLNKIREMFGGIMESRSRLQFIIPGYGVSSVEYEGSGIKIA